MRRLKVTSITRMAIYWLIFLTSAGCFGLIDSSSDRIMGPYKVAWIDVYEQQFICEDREDYPTICQTLVPEYVFAVGHDENFIIAKQHPTSGFDNGFKIDSTVTNYYILDTREEIEKLSKKIIGPLTRKEFDEKRRQLRIEKIEFEMNYPDIP
jgi:hypothetical protein